VTDDELRVLQEQVTLIQTMSESQGWWLLVQEARGMLVAKQMKIIQGKCKTYEEYKMDCSFGDGIEYLLKLPTYWQNQLDQELSERRDYQEAIEEAV
jgi:hypothetical protein